MKELLQIYVLSLLICSDPASQQCIRCERYVGCLLLLSYLGDLHSRLSRNRDSRLTMLEVPFLHHALNVFMLLLKTHAER